MRFNRLSPANEWYYALYALTQPFMNRCEHSQVEKHGKCLWSTRYLYLVGCRLLVFRHSVKDKQGNNNIPLNALDLTNALVQKATIKRVLIIVTHRKVGISI